MYQATGTLDISKSECCDGLKTISLSHARLPIFRIE